MEAKNYVACKDILGIQTNCKEKIGWSFGYPPEPVSDEEIHKCRLVVRFIVDPLATEGREKQGLQKYHYWRAEQSKDELFYQRNFFGGTKLRLLAKGLLTNRPEVWANKRYVKHIRWRFNNLHSPGYILTDMVCALLLKKDLCALHCSAFSLGDSTVVVIAPPDTGKTLAIMRAVFDHEASFISEDLAIIDGENIYACPWTSTFRYYDELSMSRIMAIRMKLIKVMPVVEILPFPGTRKTIDNYIGKERILDRSRVTHIVILARRDGGLQSLDKTDALKMVLNLNHYEFGYRKSPMLTAYSYFNPEFDPEALVEREKEILARLVNQSECFLVQSKDPTEFADLIKDKIG